MSEYDFTGLTRAQQALLTMSGWMFCDERPQPSPRTVAKLIRRGLVVPEKTPVLHAQLGAGFTITEYRVPTHVHMAWCEHCSRLESKPGRRKPA